MVSSQGLGTMGMTGKDLDVFMIYTYIHNVTLYVHDYMYVYMYKDIHINVFIHTIDII